MAPEKKPPTPEEAAHIEELQKEFVAATGTGPVVKAPRAKAAPAPAAAKAAKAKDTATRCRFGEGRYYSKPADPWCPLERAKGKQLCAAHEKVMSAARKAAKEAGTAKAGTPRTPTKAAAPAKPKVAPNSGGQKSTRVPPTRPMGSGPISIAMPQPAMTMLVAEGPE